MNGINRQRVEQVLAIPEGLEPPTNSLEGCCSIQLSYGTSATAPFSAFRRKGNALVGAMLGRGPNNGIPGRGIAGRGAARCAAYDDFRAENHVHRHAAAP